MQPDSIREGVVMIKRAAIVAFCLFITLFGISALGLG